MRAAFACVAATTLLAVSISSLKAQAQEETTEATSGGGISVPGWKGSLDPRDAQSGKSVNEAKLSQEAGALHVTTGPTVTYWQPAHRANGDYTVSATFTEPKYMGGNSHAHPYGIVIAGNEMGTPQQSYLYCAAYGNGSFIVRGFGPEPFQMNGRRGEENAAVHKAGGPGQPVTQEIAVSVKGEKVSCSINGSEVASYDKAALVAPGKLKSTDGVYGIRAGEHTHITVSNLKMKTD